jgi:RimJ/RimL family protein N-acetyltransferase
MSIGFLPKLSWLDGRHLQDIEALAEDEALEAGTVPSFLHSGESADAFVAGAQRLRARGLQATFAIQAGGRFVGLIALARDSNAPGRAELGYWIGPPYRGRGYATAAGARILEHGFRRMCLALVVARCRSDNPASARVLEKLAFRLAGAEPTHDRTGVEIHRYELTGAACRRPTSRA